MHANASDTINMPAPYPDHSQASISAFTRSTFSANIGRRKTKALTAKL